MRYLGTIAKQILADNADKTHFLPVCKFEKYSQHWISRWGVLMDFIYVVRTVRCDFEIDWALHFDTAAVGRHGGLVIDAVHLLCSLRNFSRAVFQTASSKLMLSNISAITLHSTIQLRCFFFRVLNILSSFFFLFLITSNWLLTRLSHGLSNTTSVLTYAKVRNYSASAFSWCNSFVFGYLS